MLQVIEATVATAEKATRKCLLNPNLRPTCPVMKVIITETPRTGTEGGKPGSALKQVDVDCAALYAPRDRATAQSEVRDPNRSGTIVGLLAVHRV
jgi:hypothetical protein